jgi:hypothetical protein
VPVYRGVVKGKVVLLPDDADLADGAAVEVRPIAPAGGAKLPRDAELRFRQRLIEVGLLVAPSPREPRAVEDRTPVRVQGRPLSADILSSRR